MSGQCVTKEGSCTYLNSSKSIWSVPAQLYAGLNSEAISILCTAHNTIVAVITKASHILVTAWTWRNQYQILKYFKIDNSLTFSPTFDSVALFLWKWLHKASINIYLCILQSLFKNQLCISMRSRCALCRCVIIKT